MRIQNAKHEDLKSIWEIKQTCVELLSSLNIKTWDETYPSFEVFETDQKNNNLYAIIENDVIIGSVCVNNEMSEEYSQVVWSDTNFKVIHRLMINPGMRGKGFAIKAINHLEKEIFRKGITSIRLAVYEHNKGAKALYEKLNYILMGKVSMRNGIAYMYEKSKGTK